MHFISNNDIAKLIINSKFYDNIFVCKIRTLRADKGERSESKDMAVPGRAACGVAVGRGEGVASKAAALLKDRSYG